MFSGNKFSNIRQKDGMQCGVAVLAMICKYYGKDYSIDSLQKFCTPTNEGVSLKGISDAAEEIGLKSVSARLSVDKLSYDFLPCILHWNQNHFVVLYKIDKNGNRYWISDPAKGNYKLSREEFESHWISMTDNGIGKGVALFFEPTSEFGKLLAEDKPKRSFRFILGYLVQYRKLFYQIITGLLLGSLLQLILPFLTQWIVDLGIKHEDIGLIWLILLGEVVIVIGRTLTDFIRRWLLLHISMRINISLVSDFFIKLLRLPMSFFDTKLMGDLLQRIGDHGRIQSFLTNQVLGVLFSILSFVVFGIVLLLYDAMIFGIFMISSVVYGIWVAFFLKRRRVLDYSLFEVQAVNQNCTYQFITSIQEIKLQDCERRRRWEWEDAQADLFNVQMKVMKLQQTQEAGSIFINEIKNIFITVLAATAVINGEITLGAMLAIQYIVGQLNSPIEQLMQFIYSIQDVKISLERINEIHERNDEDTEKAVLKEFDKEKSIRIRNIDFKYNRHALKNTLEDVSFAIPDGKVTAIVGASGSGKTTLIKLMLGYYPVDSGAIEIAGNNIKDYDMKWWRRQCGVVMQDGIIFSESIARNIAVDDQEIDFDRLEKAASIACIQDYIKSLPLKYDTKIGADGTGLSQGQKQRILIARAVYKNPDFIFLDEATNSLDAKNERAIVENLDRFYTGKTVVIVAHRLSTVKNADNIVVIDDGKIVESGKHEELLRNRSVYYNLVKNQLELGS